MKRRRFVLGFGAASVGVAGNVGTGAVSQIAAGRDVQATVVGDEHAYLRLSGVSRLAKNTEDEGLLFIDLAEALRNVSAGGQGFNPHSVYEVTAPGSFDAIFAVGNRSDRDLEIAASTVSDVDDIDESGDPTGFREFDALAETDPRIELFDVTDPDREAIDVDDPYHLGTGRDLEVAIRVIIPDGVDLTRHTLQVIFQAIEA